MTVLAFVLFWVLVGAGLLFVALSGGPRGARQRLHSQSRTGNRVALTVFAVGFLALGIAVPVLVTAAVQSRDSLPEANIASLTSQEEEGRDLFGERCANCHALAAANASARVGPNLDQLRPGKELVLDAIQQGRARGNGQMAADLVVGENAEAVAAFVAKAVGQTGQPTPAPGNGEQAEPGG